jgi:hypothetical protein
MRLNHRDTFLFPFAAGLMKEKHDMVDDTDMAPQGGGLLVAACLGDNMLN